MISIITPVYNAEKTVGKTIDSVINQTFAQWELLLIDDCSTDNSVEIIENFTGVDNRIKLIKNTQNQGVAKSRNEGLKSSKYDLIAFLDADDYFHKKKLEIFIDKINSYPTTPIFFSSYIRFNEDRTLSKTKVPRKVTYNKLLYTNDIMTSTVVVNRKITSTFYFKNYYHEDFVCWLELTKKNGPAIGIRDYLTFYRVHKNTLSSNKLKSSKKVYFIYRDFLKKNIIQTYFYMSFYFLFAVKKHFIHRFFNFLR